MHFFIPIVFTLVFLLFFLIFIIDLLCLVLLDLLQRMVMLSTISFFTSFGINNSNDKIRSDRVIRSNPEIPFIGMLQI